MTFPAFHSMYSLGRSCERDAAVRYSMAKTLASLMRASNSALDRGTLNA